MPEHLTDGALAALAAAPPPHLVSLTLRTFGTLGSGALAAFMAHARLPHLRTLVCVTPSADADALQPLCAEDGRAARAALPHLVSLAFIGSTPLAVGALRPILAAFCRTEPGEQVSLHARASRGLSPYGDGEVTVCCALPHERGVPRNAISPSTNTWRALPPHEPRPALARLRASECHRQSPVSGSSTVLGRRRREKGTGNALAGLVCAPSCYMLPLSPRGTLPCASAPLAAHGSKWANALDDDSEDEDTRGPTLRRCRFYVDPPNALEPLLAEHGLELWLTCF